MTHDEKPNVEFSDTNKEFIDAVEDKIYAELVETMEGIENDTWMVWEESSINILGLPEEQNSAMLEEETQEDYKAKETPVVVGLAEAVDGGIEVANEDELEEVGITCCNPTLAKCGGEAQHLEKLKVWSPPGLLNV
jgi:hypothetical protein